MEPKKTAKADLTRKTFLFFNVGLVTSLSLTIFAFTFKTADDASTKHLANQQTLLEEIVDVPVTEQLPPPPPKVELPQIVEVPDDTNIEEEINVDIDMEKVPTEVVNTPAHVEVEIEEEDPNEVFTIVEEGAGPVGGMSAFNEFLAKNMVYPRQASRMGVEGKVFVQFVVERDGSITNVQAIKGIGAGCDEEAVRVVKLAPKWKPGKQRGKPVRQKMILPINFTMQ